MIVDKNGVKLYNITNIMSIVNLIFVVDSLHRLPVIVVIGYR